MQHQSLQILRLPAKLFTVVLLLLKDIWPVTKMKLFCLVNTDCSMKIDENTKTYIAKCKRTNCSYYYVGAAFLYLLQA